MAMMRCTIRGTSHRHGHWGFQSVDGEVEDCGHLGLFSLTVWMSGTMHFHRTNEFHVISFFAELILIEPRSCTSFRFVSDVN